MSVETNPHNYTNMNNTFSQSFLPARNSPKENSGANGKFLPKPLLFHLRHPNSKTNQPKFWQILSSPKNSFAKTSSAFKPRHTARILGGQNPKKKNVLSILEKITPAKNQKSKEHFFFLGLPSGARRRRGFHWLGIFDKVSSSEVGKTLQKKFRLNFAKVF